MDRAVKVNDTRALDYVKSKSHVQSFPKSPIATFRVREDEQTCFSEKVKLTTADGRRQKGDD